MAKRSKPPRIWAELLAHNVKFAEQVLIARGSIQPMVIVHQRDGAISPILLRMIDEKQKPAVYHVLAMMIAAVDAIAVSCTIEAWMRRLDKRHRESDAEHRTRGLDGPSPSQAEDRIEVVIATLLYRDAAGQRQALIHLGEIIRNTDGKPTGLKALDDEVSMQAPLDGALANIMSEFPVDAETRRKAQAILAAHGEQLMAKLGMVEIP